MNPEIGPNRLSTPNKLRLIIGAVACAAVAYLGSADKERDVQSVRGLAPAPITKERQEYLDKLPLVEDAELHDFVSEQKIKFSEDISKIRKLSGKTLEAGDTVSWISNLTVGEDWTIHLSPVDPENRPKYNPDAVEMSLATSNELDPGDGRWVTNEKNGNFSMNKEAYWGLRPAVEENTEIEGLEESADTGSIPNRNDTVRFQIAVARKYHEKPMDSPMIDEENATPQLDNKIEVIETADMKLSLNWFAGKEKKTGTVSRENQDAVVSERRLPKRLFDRIYKKALFYRSYLDKRKPVTLISDNPISGGATYEAYEDTIVLPLKYTKRPTTQDHESAHALYSELEDQKRVKGLEALAEKISAHIEPDQSRQLDSDALDGCSKEYSDVYKLFDETTYEPRYGCNAGHPTDNANELFASALSVLRYYPGRLARHFKNIKVDTEKQQAQDVINQILLLTDELANKQNRPPIIPSDSVVRKIG